MEFWSIVISSSIVTSIALFLLELGKEYIKEGIRRRSGHKQKWFEKRDEKRIAFYDELYSKLDQITDITISEDQIITLIQDIELFLKKNNLYLDDDIQKIMIEAIDYFKDILSGKNYREISKEGLFLKKFKNKFNK